MGLQLPVELAGAFGERKRHSNRPACSVLGCLRLPGGQAG